MSDSSAAFAGATTAIARELTAFLAQRGFSIDVAPIVDVLLLEQSTGARNTAARFDLTKRRYVNESKAIMEAIEFVKKKMVSKAVSCNGNAAAGVTSSARVASKT